MGLPTPNVFAGGVNFHSKFEWVAVRAMEKAVLTAINIGRVWAEEG
jgi:tripeptide aminopeptidase